MKLYNIGKLASKYSRNHKIIGLRPGEKYEEILLTKTEKKNSIEKKDMWVIKQPNFRL